MKARSLNELRDMYRSFFETKQHLKLPSYPLVPIGDKSLLLINSGMAPLKPYFTGAEEPPRKRVTTSQKCIRTGDIENVGKTARHGTFFEMLGNFSFGDYFKREAISWAWEFCTEVLSLPKDRLYVSVYHEDDEALNIWHKEIGIDLHRIFKMGKEDNFWEVGLGPCGPCSEIYFDRGLGYGCGKDGCTVGCDCDRYIEFWNLVFTQFSKEEDGSYSNLPNPNIDTGMGLERLAMMMQDVESIFDIDTVKAIRNKVCKISGVSYGASEKGDISIRVITDHVRSVVFMIADGVLPSSEGRGYVLRRILRRAVRHGKLLGIKTPFLVEVAETAVQQSYNEYTELSEKLEHLKNIISIEQQRFSTTIDQGSELLVQQIEKLRTSNSDILSGESAFHLYDTYGFPLELTLEILEEEGLSADTEGFENHMQQQRERARAARGDSNFMGADTTAFDSLNASPTTFTGYESLTEKSQILAVIVDDIPEDKANTGDKVAIILDTTPFYGESGGQVGDVGTIFTDTATVRIHDTKRVIGGLIAHLGVVEGTLFVAQEATATVEATTRASTCRNHSATHLLHKSLRDVLGKHVEQAGSLVTSKSLRFDFTHFTSLTPQELETIEAAVNAQVLAAHPIDYFTKSLDEARSLGAIALFGEKYGDIVRVVHMGESIELCGGVHCSNTGQVGLFKIISESSVGAGVRRIEAITGTSVITHIHNLEQQIVQASTALKTSPQNLVKQASATAQGYRESIQELDRLRIQNQATLLDESRLRIETVGDFTIASTTIENLTDTSSLKDIADRLKQRYDIVIIANSGDGKAGLCVMATDRAVKAGAKAGDIIKASISILDGRGGGKPNMAMAGGNDNGKIQEAINTAHTKAQSQITS